MWRSGVIVCALCATAAAQSSPVAVADPVPTSSPPSAYPPPPSAAPPPGYAPIYTPEPPPRSDRYFVALHVGFGGGGKWLYGAYSAEAAATLITAPVRLRARLHATLVGGTIESDWTGGYHRYLAGVEGRWCTRRLVACWFADVDVGYEHLSLYDMSDDFVRSDSGLVAGPRFGFDIGGGVRFRMALELYQHYGRHHSRTVESRMDRFGTIGLAIAVGYQF